MALVFRAGVPMGDHWCGSFFLLKISVFQILLPILSISYDSGVLFLWNLSGHRLNCGASQESLDEVDFSAHLFDSMDAEVFARFGLLQGQPGQAASVMAHCVQMKQVPGPD